MPRSKRKTKAEDLARVRNNQRRSRQRKRDYVEELERRLTSIEDTTSREILRLRSLTDELFQENEKLKALLDLRGIDYGFATPNKRMTNKNDALRDTSSHLVPLENTSLIGYTENTISRDIRQLNVYPSPSTSGKSKDIVQGTSSLPDLPEIEQDLGSLLLLEQDKPDMALSTEVSKDEYQDTTLCAVALELVTNCNKKNLSILELDMRLRCGYRNARFQWDGCRVDNQVLFAVLAEIM
ncbi:predicted protein [Paecilomyces variotii No. 5]|uniref:BZIP domain-containing protein n=1 Tax=Byssochlamys spectabilis (strain No. 5 / NBRC 109023) TaxID=1356009 RepID=V5FM89_BYSSN|nr:predicted protein [Paecilomyces variotii No. 5]